MYILQKKDKPRTAVQSIGPQTKYNVIHTTHIKITCIMVMSTRDWIPQADRTQHVSGRIIKLSNITSE